MPQNTTFLPVLKGKRSSRYPIKDSPERGKGIVYSVEWGFRVDKANSYTATGEYIGLTSSSAAERFLTHLQAAKRLKYGYGVIDGRRESVISGSVKKDDDISTPKLFYIPFRTAMGPSGKDIYPNQTYKYLSVIDHVNLFDLAHTEIKNIDKSGTFSPSAGGYDGYADLVRKAAKVGRVGFNSSPGGEGNKINTGGQGYSEITHRELVMAAFYFIIEGRGAGPLRQTVGIKGASLATDVARVFKYFKDEATGYEKMGPKTRKKVSYLMKKDAEPSKNLERIISELGIEYFKTTSGGKISKKEKLINTVIRYGLGSGAQVSISRWDIQNFIAAADKITGLSDEKKGIDLMVFNVEDQRQRKKIIKTIKSQQFMLKALGTARALGLLTKKIRIATNNPNFKLSAEVWNNAYSNLDKAMKDFLEKNPEFAGEVGAVKDTLSESAKRERKKTQYLDNID